MKNILIILLLLINSVIQVQATVYHVAASGGDFSTLAQVTAHTFVAGDQVLFNRGETFYGSLEIKQSGTSGSRIIYGAYGTGANPIITGFTTVSAWTDLGSNIWESTSAVSALSTLNMVTVNGVNTAMGRYPNADTANSGYLTYQTSTTTSITSSDLTGTPDWTNAELVVRTRYYFYSREAITSQSVGTVHWTTAISPSNGYGFFIQNDARTLDQQNEWYYDTSTKKLKMYSVGQPSDVKVASVAYPIWFSNTNSPTSYITVENIDINGSNSEAIFRWSFGSTANKAHHIIINNCNVTDAGISGVSMGGNNLTVSNCNVTDVNGTAINVGYDQVSTITDNTMNNVGLLMGMCQTSSAYYYGAVCGINASHNAHSLIQYNRIINVGYDGINAGGSGTHATTVSNNFIQNYCLTQGDGGGIYWNNGASITCSYNIILHGVAPIEGTNQSFAQAVGLYLDDSADSSEVSYNTVYDASVYGLQMNSTYHINVHHNTIYASGRYEMQIQRWIGRSALVGNDFTYNKFIGNTGTSSLKVASWVSTANDIPTFGISNYNYYCRPLLETTIIYVNQPSPTASYTLAQWQSFSGQDANSHVSPKTITDVADLQFYYNDHKTDSVIVVNQRSINMAGTVYSGNVTLAPFTALVLIKDATTTNYYVSNAGNDSNDGKSTALPIATLPKVNSLSLVAGDNVFFKRGDSWFGQLVPKSGGSATQTGIYCMGDSQTSGDYPPLLQTSLGSSFLIHDKGVGGNTTGDMWTRFTADVTQYSDVNYVIIMGGTNDSWGGVGGIPLDENITKANLTSMYAAAKTKGATVVAMTITPNGLSAGATFINHINTWIKARPTNVDYVVDTYAAMDDPSNPGHLRAEDTSDGIHYTSSGNIRVLNAILAIVTFNPVVNVGDITYSAYGTGVKPLIHEAISMNNTSDWINSSGNIWTNAVPTLGSELSTNLTDAADYSGITMTFTSPAVGSGAVDAVDYNSSPKSWKVTATTTGGAASKILIRNNTGFAVTADHYYSVSFYAKSTANFSPTFSFYSTDWGTQVFVDKVPAITTSYTKFTYILKALSTKSLCMFVGYLGLLPTGNSINFDDFTVKEVLGYPFQVEIANVIFNSDASVAVRKWSTGTLTTQGDYFYDKTNKFFYLYSVGNPASYYTAIKAVEATTIVSIGSKSYITLDNLALKYGDYGISGEATSYISCKNLDVGWIGGSEFSNPVRRGNGIEFYGAVSNNLVENCKIWECFDAGITNQADPAVASVQTNITYKNNQIWNCEYSYEYFNRNASATTTNITFENNTCYNAGGGWGHAQRSDPTGWHLRLAGTPTNTTNFIIRNNIFDTSTSAVIANIFSSNNLYSIDYNCIRSVTGNIGYLNGTSYSTFSGYKTASGWDVNSINADPLFVSEVNKNFNLYLQSPAINMGDPTSSFDPDGTRRDIGALYFNIITQPNLLYRLSRNSTTGKYRYNPTTLKWIMR